MHDDKTGESWKWDGGVWQDNRTLESVTVTAKKKPTPVNFINWPNVYKDQPRWNDVMYSRVRDHKSLSQPGDPVWLAGQLSFHLKNYKAQEDGRMLQGIFLIGMAAPVASVGIAETGLGAWVRGKIRS